jgi:endonuclease YncB( thermonuclease family)
MRRFVWMAALMISGCSSGPASPAVLEEGDVVKVVGTIKGDEITVDKQGHAARVRLIGIHAFDAVVADAQIAALTQGGVAALQEIVLNQEVKLTFDKQTKDASGRYLAYADKDGVDVNRRLLEEGWAVAYTEFAFVREAAYLTAEVGARQKEKNIWGLRPAAELVKGLRKQWREARTVSGGTAPADTLLDEAQAEAPAPGR